jgi:hypothetical protein
MATISECYCTAARKMSSFCDKALADAGMVVAQYSILAAVERRVDEPPTMKETGGPRHGSIDAWAELSSTGTRGTHHDDPEQWRRAQQADLSFSAWRQRPQCDERAADESAALMRCGTSRTKAKQHLAARIRS